jgi:Tol biopolymer transport system component
MGEHTALFERAASRYPEPALSMDELLRRRDRMHRNRRLRAGILGVIVAFAVGMLLVRTLGPTDVPADLGIFADVRGWIAYADPSGLESGAWFADPSGLESGIWAIDPANPDAEPILLYPDGGLPLAWSNDGSKLLIDTGRGLLVLDADGTTTRVADLASGFGAATFTPDGSQVIYVAKDGIYSVAADGGSPRRVGEAIGYVSTVAISPDGSQLAWFEGHGDAANSLWVGNVDGTDRHRIIGEDMAGRTPWSLQWSPDGTRLAFKRGHDRSFGVVNADGTDLSFVRSFATVGADGTETSVPAFVLDLGPLAGPYWSPDGTRLAFACGCARSLAIANPDGTELQEFPSGGPGPWNPLDPA